MKKSFLFLFAIIATAVVMMAQAPQALNYQSVVRDAGGNPLASTAVQLRFTIHDGTPTGTSVYTETVSATSNQFGLVNTIIGGTASLSAVNWSTGGGKFLQVELSLNGGSTFTDMGTSQLLSVPYALNSGSVSGTINRVAKFTSASTIGNSQIFDDGSEVGIGTNAPSANLHVLGATDAEVIIEGATSSGRLLLDGPLGTYNTLQYYENGTYKGEIYHAPAATGDYIGIWQNGGDRLVVRDNKIGIGTSNPQMHFHSANDRGGAVLNAEFDQTNSGSGFCGIGLRNTDGTVSGFNIYATGSNAANFADMAGFGYSAVNASAFNVSSDRNVKKEIVDIQQNEYSNYLKQIRKIESATYRYNWEDNTTREFPHVGFIAQSLPNTVTVPMNAKPDGTSSEKIIGYNLSDMIGLTVIGVKAVDYKVQELEKVIEQLRNEIKELRNK